MSNLKKALLSLDLTIQDDYSNFINHVEHLMVQSDYEIVDKDITKPWGAYFRTDSVQAERFIEEFFPGLTVEEASLGIENAELSPKILVVIPGQRLSWQYHDRRAERWNFLTDGAYRKSVSDEQGERIEVHPGEVIQFQKGERHRLEGQSAAITLVAEIWQHSDPTTPSNEEDIVRLEDDYKR